LDKLVDGENTTTQDVHMWMVPFTADGIRCSLRFSYPL
jgi:hypothetical protein